MSKKRAVREFTPSTPRPRLGHPQPVATVGGMANGDEAEKYEIDRTFGAGERGGGKRMLVAIAVFSGMARKDGMRYLHINMSAGHVRKRPKKKVTNLAYERVYPCTTTESHPLRCPAKCLGEYRGPRARPPSRSRPHRIY
jgi:hypothetical protein